MATAVGGPSEIVHFDPRCSRAPFVLTREQYVECSRKSTYVFSVAIAILTLLIVLIMFWTGFYTRHVPTVLIGGGALSLLYFCLRGAAAERAGLEWDGYEAERQALLARGMNEPDVMKEIFRSYNERQLAPMSDILGVLLLL